MNSRLYNPELDSGREDALDQPGVVSYVEGTIASDFMNPYTEIVRAENRQALAKAFQSLSGKNQQLLILRFGLTGEAESQASTAQIMGVTRQNAQQMEVRALRALNRLLLSDFS